MSRVSEVLKTKNLVEKSHRARRKEELAKLKNTADYKAALNNAFKHIDLLLNCRELDGVVVKVPEKQLAQFSESIYSEELSGYDIVQVSGEPDQFIIRQRLI